MIKLKAYIMKGLGDFSEGITVDMAGRLMRIPGIVVQVGSYEHWRAFADDARALPPGVMIFGGGHSLGGSCLPNWARRVGKPIEFITGWDPADNLAANFSDYALASVPPNVILAEAIFKPGGALGGGTYTAEDEEMTTIRNTPIEDDSHTGIENAIEDHLTVIKTAKRLIEA